ncbi:hypothetical protein EV122DRAFT_266604, partial [Schizophyllum commune]
CPDHSLFPTFSVVSATTLLGVRARFAAMDYITELDLPDNMKLAVFTLVAITATMVDASLHPIIAARRLNLRRQDPANVCTVIPAQTITVTGANPVELPAVCLCSNTVDAYAEDLGLNEAATAEISRDLQTDIDDSDTPCTAPSNGMPTCNDDECDFACDAGFVRDGDMCVCPTGQVQCGARCIAAGAPCASGSFGG